MVLSLPLCVCVCVFMNLLLIEYQNTHSSKMGTFMSFVWSSQLACLGFHTWFLRLGLGSGTGLASGSGTGSGSGSGSGLWDTQFSSGWWSENTSITVWPIHQKLHSSIYVPLSTFKYTSLTFRIDFVSYKEPKRSRVVARGRCCIHVTISSGPHHPQVDCIVLYCQILCLLCWSACLCLQFISY